MRLSLTALLALLMTVSGCGFGASKLNPFNWFGGEEEVTTLEPGEGYAEALGDYRVQVQQVTRLEVTPSTSGAVVSAAGLPPTQGWWDAELIAENDGYPVDGVMSYRFVVAEPQPGTPVAGRVLTPQSREVTAAAYINNARLQSVRRIVVSGETNARSVNR